MKTYAGGKSPERINDIIFISAMRFFIAMHSASYPRIVLTSKFNVSRVIRSWITAFNRSGSIDFN